MDAGFADRGVDAQASAAHQVLTVIDLFTRECLAIYVRTGSVDGIRRDARKLALRARPLWRMNRPARLEI